MKQFIQNILAKWTKLKKRSTVKRRDLRVRLAVEQLDQRILLNAGPDPTWFTPAQLRNAYGFDKVGVFTSGAPNSQIMQADGRGQTIAIVDVDDDPNIAADLRTFSTQFGLVQMDGVNGDPTFTVLKQGNVPTSPRAQTSKDNNSPAVETAIDVEWAHAIAPGANIVLVEAPSINDPDINNAALFASSLPGVSVVSLSFSDSLSDPGPLTRPGVTFVSITNEHNQFEFPFAGGAGLIVGGTQLSTDSAGNYLSEVVYSKTGGGAFEDGTPLPSWQSAAAANVHNDTGEDITTRLSPDLSYNAVNYAVVDSYDWDSPWVAENGTSIGAPQVAAMIAIANEGRSVLLPSRGPLNSIDPTLPMLYSLPASDFHDIQSGQTSVGFLAFPGYDRVNGLGSPHADLIIRDLMQPFHGYYSAIDYTTGKLTVYGNDSIGDINGVDHITISTQNDSTGNWLVVTDNYKTDRFDINTFHSIEVNTRSIFDTVDVLSTPSYVPITINLAGSRDTVNLSPNDQLLSDLGGDVTVNTFSGQNTLNVYDRNNSDRSSPNTYWVNGSSLTSLYTPAVNFYGMSNVNLYGSSGNSYRVGDTINGPTPLPSFKRPNANITLDTRGAGSRANTITVVDELYTDPTNSSKVDFSLDGLSGLHISGHATDKFAVDNTPSPALPSGVIANPQTITAAGDPVNGGMVAAAYSYHASNGNVSGQSGFSFDGPNTLEIDGGRSGETFRIGDGTNGLDWLPAGLSLVLKGKAGDKLILNDHDLASANKPTFTSSNPVFTVASATAVSRDNTFTYANNGQPTSVTTHAAITFTSNISSLEIDGGSTFTTTYNLSNLNAPIPSMHIVGGAHGIVNISDQQATTSQRTYTVTNASVGWGSTSSQLTYSGLTQLNFDGGNGNQTFNVTSTAANTTTRLQAHGLSNSFIVGSLGLDGIKGALDLHGAPSASNYLTLADNNSATAHIYALSKGVLKRTDTANHSDMTAISFDTAFGSVSLYGSAQAGTIVNVLSTNSATFTQIGAGQGNSVIIGQFLNSSNPSLGRIMPGIQGVVSIRGYSPGTTFQTLLDDSADSAAHANVLFDNDGNGPGVSGLVPAKIYLAQNASSPVTVQGSAGGDTFKVKTLPPFQLTITGGSAATDVLDYSAYVGDVIVDLPLGSATGLKSISGIENVVGSQGNNLIVGNSGTTSIIGGTGRNVLIGGGGAVNLDASRSGGDNLLIGGTTSYDQQINALDAIFAEWTRTDLAFADRVSDLQFGFNHAGGGGGSVGGGAIPMNEVNGSLILLNSSTVKAGSASATMTGGAGQNWYFIDLDDSITNFNPNRDQKTAI